MNKLGRILYFIWVLSIIPGSFTLYAFDRWGYHHLLILLPLYIGGIYFLLGMIFIFFCAIWTDLYWAYDEIVNDKPFYLFPPVKKDKASKTKIVK